MCAPNLQAARLAVQAFGLRGLDGWCLEALQWFEHLGGEGLEA